MSSRTGRTSSIPIPRGGVHGGSQRNIESLISGPFISPTHTHSFSSSPRNTPPVRSNVRSASLSTFEPRVIRGPPSDTQSAEPQCFTPSTSHPQSRRPAALSPRASSSAHKATTQPQAATRLSSDPVPIPSYLEYSSLRHLLQTDPAVTPIPARRATESQIVPPRRYQSYTSAPSPSSGDDDDGTASPPPSDIRSPPGPAVGPSTQQTFKLPTRWSETDRHPNLSLSPDGRELTYQGASCSGDKEAAAARTTHHIPPACGIFYYEVEILGKDQKSRISIGFSARTAKYNRLPGWEPHTWGYYGDDSPTLNEKSGVHHGSPYGSGDTIGCGVDYTTHKAFYTKNGTLIGPAFENVGRGVDLYPAIGLQHLGEVIRANFGQDPFKYDIDSHVQQARTATWNRIMSTQLSSSLLRRVCQPTVGSIASITHDTGGVLSEEQSKVVLNQLVQSYLIHHGYAKTARALENKDTRQPAPADQDVDMNPPPSSTPVQPSPTPRVKSDITEDIENRIRVVNYVLAGDIDNAITDLERFYPKVLAADGKFMLFQLRCRKFIELMLGTSEIRKRVKKLKEKEALKKKAVGAPALAVAATPSSSSVRHDEFWMDEDMDVDDEGAESATGSFVSLDGADGVSTAALGDGDDGDDHKLSQQYEAALNEAIEYGRSLSDDYQSDSREEVQDIFKKTCGIVAWDDPLDPRNPLASFASAEARTGLAHQVNDAILKSQGKPPQPLLESLYRRTAASILQLGMLGVGTAAFADIRKELLS